MKTPSDRSLTKQQHCWSCTTLFAFLISIIVSYQSQAQFIVLATRGGQAQIISGDGKANKVLNLGMVLPPNTQLTSDAEAQVLLWGANKLIQVTAADNEIPLEQLAAKVQLGQPVFETKPTLAYLESPASKPVFTIQQRLALKYSLNQYPVDSITGFMIAIAVPNGDKSTYRKRCSTWGDSVVIDRKAMALPSFGSGGGPSQLFYFKKEEKFYKLLGNVHLLDKDYVKSSLEPFVGLFAGKPLVQQRLWLTQYLLWCYSGLLQADCQQLINEWVAAIGPTPQGKFGGGTLGKPTRKSISKSTSKSAKQSR